jgi:hypothetical protein
MKVQHLFLSDCGKCEGIIIYIEKLSVLSVITEPRSITLSHKRIMKRQFLTFLGAGSATFIWGSLIMSLNFSAPNRTASVLGPLAVSVVIGIIFTLCEYLINRKRRQTFAQIAIDTGIVAFFGSLTSLVGLFLALVLLGYIDTRYLFLEMFSILFLGSLLFTSTFVVISLLKLAECLLERRRTIRLE